VSPKDVQRRCRRHERGSVIFPTNQVIGRRNFTHREKQRTYPEMGRERGRGGACSNALPRAIVGGVAGRRRWGCQGQLPRFGCGAAQIRQSGRGLGASPILTRQAEWPAWRSSTDHGRSDARVFRCIGEGVVSSTATSPHEGRGRSRCAAAGRVTAFPTARSSLLRRRFVFVRGHTASYHSLYVLYLFSLRGDR